jgi:hypothetical protein
MPSPGESGPDDMNPVLEALNTLQTFVAAQKEKGNKNYENMAKALLSVVQAFSGDAQEVENAGGGNVPEQPIRPADRGGRPEMAGRGSRPVMPSL